MTNEQDREIEKMACRLYSKCYIGHIPWEHWRKLAEFVLAYGRDQYRAGHGDGAE